MLAKLRGSSSNEPCVEIMEFAIVKLGQDGKGNDQSQPHEAHLHPVPMTSLPYNREINISCRAA